MSQTLEIPIGERGRIRVFSLSMDREAAETLKGNSAALEQVFQTEIDIEYVEVFDLADLGDMSFVDYLVEGPGIEASALAAERVTLDALEGWVMVVYSGAFEDTAGPITPDPALRLLGTYPQQGIDWSEGMDLSAASAKPYQGDAGVPEKKRSDAAIAGRVATAALLVLFALVGLMVWIGG